MINIAYLLSWYDSFGDIRFKPVVHNSPLPKQQYLWDSVQLSKQERKGKSYEEMQALRETKYETRKE